MSEPEPVCGCGFWFLVMLALYALIAAVILLVVWWT